MREAIEYRAWTLRQLLFTVFTIWYSVYVNGFYCSKVQIVFVRVCFFKSFSWNTLASAGWFTKIAFFFGREFFFAAHLQCFVSGHFTIGSYFPPSVLALQMCATLFSRRHMVSRAETGLCLPSHQCDTPATLHYSVRDNANYSCFFPSETSFWMTEEPLQVMQKEGKML